MPGKNSIKIVADTNVLLSALIGNRLRSFIDFLKNKDFSLYFTDNTIEELLWVIEKPKFDKYITLEDKEEFKKLLFIHAQIIESKEIIKDCRDPDDNIFLECAVAGKADYLVSGDKDLLDLTPYREIPIITPSRFIEILKNE